MVWAKQKIEKEPNSELFVGSAEGVLYKGSDELSLDDNGTSLNVHLKSEIRVWKTQIIAPVDPASVGFDYNKYYTTIH